jgi:hypothetical protein
MRSGEWGDRAGQEPPELATAELELLDTPLEPALSLVPLEVALGLVVEVPVVEVPAAAVVLPPLSPTVSRPVTARAATPAPAATAVTLRRPLARLSVVALLSPSMGPACATWL